MSTRKSYVFFALGVLIGCQLTQPALAGMYTKKKEPPVAVPLQTPDESTALLTFVRHHILMGDGIHHDIWDGETYIGVLRAGCILQFKATPGPHTIMLMERGNLAWVFLKADVAAGKEYFAKANPFPFFLGAADARSDTRVEEWHAMKQCPALEADDKAAVEAQNLAHAKMALELFRSGQLDPDCTTWLAPKKKIKKRRQLTASSGACRDTQELKPEFGR